MRGLLPSAAIVAASVLLGSCTSAPSDGRTFSAQFPAQDFGQVAGDINREPMPVELQDLTGTVVVLATDAQSPNDDFGVAINQGLAVGVVGRPNVLRLAWIGGACTRIARLRLDHGNPGMALTISDEWEPPIFGGVCPMGGVPRVVTIGFDRPIDAAAVTIRLNGGT